MPSDALNSEPALFRSLGHHTHGAKRRERAQHVFAFEQPGHVRDALGQRTEHHRTV